MDENMFETIEWKIAVLSKLLEQYNNELEDVTPKAARLRVIVERLTAAIKQLKSKEGYGN